MTLVGKYSLMFLCCWDKKTLNPSLFLERRVEKQKHSHEADNMDLDVNGSGVHNLTVTPNIRD